MVTFLLFLIAVSALVSGILWLEHSEGSITILWMGYEIILTTTAALLALLLVVIIVFLISHLLSWLLHSRYRRKNRHYQKAINSLSDGYIALLQHNPPEALKAAQKSQQLIGETSLSAMLSAYAHQQRGNHLEASKLFRTMLEQRDTEWVGLHGLLQDAETRKDYSTALALATDTYRKHKTRSLEPILLTLMKRTGQWHEAIRFVNGLKPLGIERLFGKQPLVNVAHEKALCLMMLAEQTGTAGSDAPKLPALKQALRSDRTFAPLLDKTIATAIHEGDRRTALSLLKDIWKKQPHLLWAERFRDASAHLPDKKRLSLALDRASEHPAHPASTYLVSLIGYAIGDYTIARDYAERAIQRAALRPFYTLWKQIEEADGAGTAILSEIDREMVHARSFSAYRCGHCHHQQDTWELVCSSCDAIDRFELQKLPTREEQILSSTTSAERMVPVRA